MIPEVDIPGVSWTIRKIPTSVSVTTAGFTSSWPLGMASGKVNSASLEMVPRRRYLLTSLCLFRPMLILEVPLRFCGPERLVIHPLPAHQLERGHNRRRTWEDGTETPEVKETRVEFGYSMESHVRDTTAEAHHDGYREFFKQVQICEDGGMDFLWISEHHFNPNRSFGSASMVVAGAVAVLTERIKIGSSILVLPTHNPLHVAEEFSNLDHLSKGRFELGVGRSGGAGGYRGFNMDYSESQLDLRSVLR